MKAIELIEILRSHVDNRTRFVVLSDGSADQCIILELNIKFHKIQEFKTLIQSEYGLDLYHYTFSEKEKSMILCFDVSKNV